MPPSNTVDEESKQAVGGVSDASNGADHRKHLERARREARRRYRDHLTAEFTRYGVADPGELADAALDALTVWRYVDSGEQCRCSCHPRLPETDLHDYGFDCVCTRAPEERRRAFQQWRNDIDAYWKSPDGQRIKAAERAEEAELQTWLANQQGVVIYSHDGPCPEQWNGEVDGHNFEFRERHGEWRIEVDIRPSGRFIRVVAETGHDGATRYQQRELDQGDVIACGTTDIEGYGTTPLDRAQFILDTIRTHLVRKACTLHHNDLSAIRAAIGTVVRWCPACGTRLSAQ